MPLRFFPILYLLKVCWKKPQFRVKHAIVNDTSLYLFYIYKLYVYNPV